MVSVTQRIKQIKQPRGGYLNPTSFTVTQLPIGEQLLTEENLHPTLVGLAVDYLTRFMMGESADSAFRISLKGARLIGDDQHAEVLLAGIADLDSYSITCACQLVGYDVVFRAGKSAYRPVELIVPNMWTIENIRIMVERSLDFFKHFGPVVKSGFHMLGGYTDVIDSGDGDFLTDDTLWDFKVSKLKPTKEHTLQLLIYYLMGLHSYNPTFQGLRYLGIYNPRLHQIYRLAIETIDRETIRIVEMDVIGY